MHEALLAAEEWTVPWKALPLPHGPPETGQALCVLGREGLEGAVVSVQAGEEKG